MYLFVQCTMWVTSFALAVKWCTWNGIHISQWERLTTILIYFVTTGEKKLSHMTAEYLNALQLSPHNCMYLVWFISFEISVLWSIVFFSDDCESNALFWVRNVCWCVFFYFSSSNSYFFHSSALLWQFVKHEPWICVPYFQKWILFCRKSFSTRLDVITSC